MTKNVTESEGDSPIKAGYYVGYYSCHEGGEVAGAGGLYHVDEDYRKSYHHSLGYMIEFIVRTRKVKPYSSVLESTSGTSTNPSAAGPLHVVLFRD